MFRQSERIDYLELLNSLLRINPTELQFSLCCLMLCLYMYITLATKTSAFLSAAFRIINLNIQNDNPDYFLEILIT